jgi:hypothetical protein
MLTPAEEMGLTGLSLASRVRKAFQRIPEADVVALLRRMEEESFRRHIVYVREGQDEAVRVMPCPVTVLPDQLAYVHAVSLTLRNALKRLPALYFEDEEVRSVLRLTPGEEAWLREFRIPADRDSDPVFARLDAVVDFISPMWKESLKFMEPNLSCVGGLHMVPAAEQLVADLVLPALHGQDGQLRLEVGTDMRELLMQKVLDHLEAVGRQARTICFVEFLNAGAGPDEQGTLARYYHDRFGLQVLHADPSELTLRGGEVCCQGEVVDLVYRDYEVRDLLALEKEGVNVEPLRELFRQNRVISSITAELDQKCCWEVLTDPRFGEHFTAEERQVFRRHVLWTRYLADRRTQLPDGHVGDLLDYVRREQDLLVLKPNRCYGGRGVALGHLMGAGEWQAAVERAMAEAERWVVQRVASIPVAEFPVLGPEGRLHAEPFYLVMGFAPTRDGLAILGRVSQKQVVNVAQRGGICAVMVGHAPGRLHGPRPLPTPDNAAGVP